eukprot:1597762-Alexandrium_andersonii.AAC.1
MMGWGAPGRRFSLRKSLGRSPTPSSCSTLIARVPSRLFALGPAIGRLCRLLTCPTFAPSGLPCSTATPARPAGRTSFLPGSFGSSEPP